MCNFIRIICDTCAACNEEYSPVKSVVFPIQNFAAYLIFKVFLRCLRKQLMLLVNIVLLLLAFYGSLFRSWIHFCIFSLSSLSYFFSDAGLITQLSGSCHICALSKTALKGRFCFGLYLNSTAPVLSDLLKGTTLRSCCGTLQTQYVPEQSVEWLFESAAKCEVWFWFISGLCLLKVTTVWDYSLGFLN